MSQPHNAPTAVCYVHGWWGLNGADRSENRTEQIHLVNRWQDCEYAPFFWEAGLVEEKRDVIRSVSRYARIAAEYIDDDVARLATQTALPIVEKYGPAPHSFKVAVLNTANAADELLEHLKAVAQTNHRIDIVAHSLGCRVVHRALSNPTAAKLVNDVFLLGGAFPAYKSWWAVSKHIDGLIYNFSSPHDQVLQMTYHPWLNGLTRKRHGRSIGRPREKDSKSGIETRLRAVQNRVTDVDGHSAYFDRLRELIDPCPLAPKPKTKGWHDEFHWESVRFKRVRRGVQAEIVQRALTQPIDGKDALLCVDDITGEYNTKTQKAVKRYQERNALPADGLIGVETWSKLVNKEAKFHTPNGVKVAKSRG